MNYNSDAKFSVYIKKIKMTNTEYDKDKTQINCTELSIDN